MASSERTKSLRKKRNIFKALDIITWIGVAIAAFVISLVAINNRDPSMPIFTEEFKALLVSLGVTVVIGIICSLVIKEKMRTAIWMISLVIFTVTCKEAGMFSILGAWALDEYIFHGLYEYYQKRLIINKEIDLREGD